MTKAFHAVPMLLVTLTVLSGGAASAVPLGPDIVVNGSFEEPVIGDGTFAVFGAIPGWTSDTLSPGGIEIQRFAAGTPFDGAQHVELDSYIPSNMFQDLSTNPGETYHIEFAYSPRPRVGIGDNAILFLWDGAPITVLDGEGGGLADTSWSVVMFDLVALDASTRLEFVDVGISDGLGGYLDDVSVQQVVPEPATLLLLGAGVTALRASARRRARG